MKIWKSISSLMHILKELFLYPISNSVSLYLHGSPLLLTSGNLNILKDFI